MGEDRVRETGERLPPDAVFELLAHFRRRRLVALLLEHGHPVSLPDAAEAVAEDEYERAVREIPPEDVKEIYMALYHCHVPKLVDFGVVAYHQERDLVAPGDYLDTLKPYLERHRNDR